MNTVDSRSIIENYSLVKNLHDQEFFDSTSLVSILKFIIYFPLGLVILLTRILLISILSVLIKLAPNLQYNSVFIRLTTFAFGIFSRLNTSKNASTTTNSNKILIANHVSCLDYLAIKSILNEFNYTEEPDFSRQIEKNESKLFHVISKFFIQILQTNSKKNSKFRIYFPEQISTNGTYGLIKFDSKLFDQDHSAEYLPLAIRVQHSLIPFKENYINSNDFVNLLVNLFVPFTLYELSILPGETKLDNESSEQFAERIRTKIASTLNVKLINQNHQSLRQIHADYKQFLKQEQIRRRQLELQQQSQRESTSRQRNESISFGDISRVALQVKDILPDASYETIKRHINLTASLDVDTVIASILDSNEIANSASTSVTSSSSSTNLSATNDNKATSSIKHQNASIMTYEERKFKLLQDARKRYLEKQKI